VPGNIINTEGKIIGKHQGLPFYTIGQRKGLGIAWPEPLYVVRLDPEKNTIIVGAKSELRQKEFYYQNIHWQLPQKEKFTAEIKIRYNSSAIRGTVYPKLQKVVLNRPAEAVTPGQAVVFYKKDWIIGGGIISNDINQESR